MTTYFSLASGFLSGSIARRPIYQKAREGRAFAAGDDPRAKSDVPDEREIGFDAVDAGPLKNARLLEPLGYLNIQLGYGMKMGTDTGFRLMHT